MLAHARKANEKTQQVNLNMQLTNPPPTAPPPSRLMWAERRWIGGVRITDGEHAQRGGRSCLHGWLNTEVEGLPDLQTEGG